MRYNRILTFMLLSVIAAVPAATWAGNDQTTRFESSSGAVDLDFGSECNKWQLFSFSIFGESSCSKQDQTMLSYEGPMYTNVLDADGNVVGKNLVYDNDGNLVKIREWKPLSATQEVTVMTPVVGDDGKVITDANGDWVFEKKTTSKEDARSGCATLGREDGGTLQIPFSNLLVGQYAGDAAAVRSFCYGIGAQDIGNGLGQMFGGGKSGFSTQQGTGLKNDDGS